MDIDISDTELSTLVAELDQKGILLKEQVDGFNEQCRKVMVRMETWLHMVDLPADSNGFYSGFMFEYLKLNRKMNNEYTGVTPQNAILGKQFEVMIKRIIHKYFCEQSKDSSILGPVEEFIALPQVSYEWREKDIKGRMEIAIEAKRPGRKIYVQVKTGFGTGTWTKIMQEKAAVENQDDEFLLVAGSEYTNPDCRDQIRAAKDWAFIAFGHDWKNFNKPLSEQKQLYLADDPVWADRFLLKLYQLYSED